jgi:hypothetical protein
MAGVLCLPVDKRQSVLEAGNVNKCLQQLISCRQHPDCLMMQSSTERLSEQRLHFAG